MRAALYPKLAWTGIKKNRKLYIPYILSCIGMVMMYYIISYISLADSVKNIPQGDNLATILGMGKFVIVAFALVFLIYTNSFLVRRRNKEFGLYNILGMDKNAISGVIVWESLIVAIISIAAGLFFGIAFSKLAELCMLYMICAESNFNLTVSSDSVKYTVLLFAAIFLVLLIKSVVNVRRLNALELMKSESTGEKPPKANWIFAVLGVIILGTAYTMSLTIKSPLSAIFSFLVAVIMVIAATYLLFMAGSVALCKILQKDKNYYYKKNHFVSVSSMAYRMKRNGAGLASICILSTMVLVMIASSASLYFGADDAIAARFPQQNQINLYLNNIESLTDGSTDQVIEKYEKVFADYNVKPKNVTQYRYAQITGLLTDGDIDPDSSHIINNMISYDNLRSLYFMSVDEYNRLMGTHLNLESGDTMTYTFRCTYNKNTFEMGGVKLNVIGKLDRFPHFGDTHTSIVPSILFVVSDLKDIQPLETLADFNGDQMLDICWYYGYDLDEVNDEAVEIFYKQKENLNKYDFVRKSEDRVLSSSYSSDCLAEQRDDFYFTFGGLFFIGIMLSIVFIFAMAMIIYYKQISEGYEDQSRFDIMQKVGMTKKDIKKSINSQTLTVFFAPLIMAGMHLGFAFSPIWKLLQLFNLNNLGLVLGVTAIAFAVFGIFYAVIYKITAQGYYKIVSNRE